MAGKGESVGMTAEDRVLKLQEELKQEKKAGRLKDHELVELRRTMNENARRNAFVITSLQNSELRLSDKVGRYSQRITSLAKHVRALQSKLAEKHVDAPAMDPALPDEPLDTTPLPEGVSTGEEEIPQQSDGPPPATAETTITALERQCEALRERNAELEKEGESMALSKVGLEKKVSRLQEQLLRGNNRRSSIVTQLQSNEAMLMSSLDDLKEERTELIARLDEAVADLAKERETNRSLESSLEEERSSKAQLLEQIEGTPDVIASLREDLVKERTAKNAALEQHKRQAAQLAAVQGELSAERDAHKHSRQQLVQERAAHSAALKQKEGATANEQALVQERLAHGETRHELDNAFQQLLRTQAVLEDERRLRAQAESGLSVAKAEAQEERSREAVAENSDSASVVAEEEREVAKEEGSGHETEAGEQHDTLSREHETAMQEMEEQVTWLKGRIRSLEEENAAQVERLRAENESMEKVLSDSVNVEETASSRLAQLEAMLEASNEQMEDLKSVLNSVRAKEQEATEALENLRLETTERHTTREATIAEMEAQILALTAKVEEKNSEAEEAAAALRQSAAGPSAEETRQQLVRDHHEQMESLHREFTKQREQLREANETLTAKLKEYHSTIVSLQQKLRTQQEEHGRISSSLQSNNARLSEQLAEYRKRMTAAAETASRLKAIQRQVPTLQKALSTQEEKYHAYESAVKLRDTKHQEHIREQALAIRDLHAKIKEMEDSSFAQESVRATLFQQLADELATCRQELAEAAEQHVADVKSIAKLTALLEERGGELARALQAAAEHEQEALSALQLEHEKDIAVMKSQLEKQQTEFLADSERLKEQVELTHAERTAAISAAEKQTNELHALRASKAQMEAELAAEREKNSKESSSYNDLQLSLARHVQMLDSVKIEKEASQSQVGQLTAKVRDLAIEQEKNQKLAAQQKQSYDEGLKQLYERHQAELRAAQQLMQQRDHIIATLKAQAEANVGAKKKYEEEIQKRIVEAQRTVEAATKERALFETRLREAAAALVETRTVADEKERSLLERLKKAQAYMEESERTLKMKEADARKTLEDTIVQLRAEITRLEEQCATEARARTELSKTCEELRQTASVAEAPRPADQAREAAPAAAPPVPMVISDRDEESQEERIKRERAEVDEKLRMLEEEKKKIKQERRQQQSEIQELNLLMGETERRHHGLLTRLQNREYELVMENQRLTAELEAATSRSSPQAAGEVSSAPNEHVDELNRRCNDLTQQIAALAADNKALKEDLKRSSQESRSREPTSADLALKERCDQLMEENGELARLVKRLQEEMAALATFQSKSRREQSDERQSANAREEQMSRLLAEAEALVKEKAEEIEKLSEMNRVTQRSEANLKQQLAHANASLADAQSHLLFARTAVEGEVRKLAPAQEAARVLNGKLAKLQGDNEDLERRLMEALSASQASDLRLSEVIATHAAEMATLRQEAISLRDAEEETRHRLRQAEQKATNAARSAAATLSQFENEIRVLKGEKSSIEVGLTNALSQLHELRAESEGLLREKEGLLATVANKDMLLVKEQSSAAEAMILLAEMQEELDALNASASVAAAETSPSAHREAPSVSAVSPSGAPARQPDLSPRRSGALLESNRLLQEELSRAREHINSMAEAVRSAESRFQEQMQREREASRAGMSRAQSQLEQAQQSLALERQRVEQLQQQLAHSQSAAEQLQRRSQSLLQSVESGASAHSRQAQEERRLRLQQQSRAEQLERELQGEREKVAAMEQAQAVTMSHTHRSVGQALQKEQQTAKLLQEHNQALQQRLQGEGERVQQMEQTIDSMRAEQLSLKESRRRLEEWAQQAQEQNGHVLQQLQATEGQRDEYADALVVAMLELEQEQTQLLNLKNSQALLTEQLRSLTQQLETRDQREELPSRAVENADDSLLATELEKSQLTASVLQEMVTNLEEQVGALQQMLTDRQQRASDTSTSSDHELRQLQSSHSHALQELRAERALVRQQEEQSRQLSLALDQRTKQCQELSTQLQKAQQLLQKHQSIPSKREGSELEMAKLHIQGLESQLVSAADQYRALEQDMQRLSSTLQGVPAEEHRRAQEMASKLEDAHREIRDLTAAADSARDAAAKAIEARRQLEAAVATLEQSLDEEQRAHVETTSLMESALISLALADEEQQEQRQIAHPQAAAGSHEVEESSILTHARDRSEAEETNRLNESLSQEEGEKSRLLEEVMQLRMRLEEYRELVTTQEGELSSLKGLLRQWKASDAIEPQSTRKEPLQYSESFYRAVMDREGDMGASGAHSSSMWQRISLLESQLDRARAAEATAQERVREMLLSREHDLNRRESGSDESAHLRAEVRMLRQLLQEAKTSAQKSRAGEESSLSSLSLLQRTHDRDLDLLADAKLALERERREHTQTKSLLEEAQQAAEEYAARTDRLRKELDSQRKAMATDASAHSTLVRGLHSKLEAALSVKQELVLKEKQMATALTQAQQQLSSKEASLNAFQHAVQEETRSHQRIILDLEAAVRQLKREKTEGLERLEEFELISGQLNELSSQYQTHMESLQRAQEALEIKYVKEVEQRTLSEQQLASVRESSAEQQRRFGRMQEQLMKLQEGSGPSDGMQSVLKTVRSQLKEEKERLQKTTGELDVEKSLRAKAEVQLQLARKTVETLQKAMARDSKSHQELVFSLQQNFASCSRAKEEQGELVTAAKEEAMSERNRTAQIVRELNLSKERCERLVAELGSTSSALVDTQVRNETLAAKLTDLKEMLNERERSLKESYASSLAEGKAEREKLSNELALRKRDNEELSKALYDVSSALIGFEGKMRPIGEIEGKRALIEESIAAEVKTLTSSSPMVIAPTGLLQLVRLLHKRLTMTREENEKKMKERERTVREREGEIGALRETLQSQALELSALSRSSFAVREEKLKEEKRELEMRIAQLEESCQGDKALARKVEGAVIGEMDALRSENLSLSTKQKAIEEEKAQLEGVVQELEEEVDVREGQLETLRGQLLHQQQLLKLARLTIMKEDEELEKRLAREQEEIQEQKVELTELFRLSQRLIRLKEESEARCQVACQEFEELHDMWVEEHEELLQLRGEVATLQEEALLSDELDERITQLEKEIEDKDVQLDLLRCVHEQEKRIIVEQLQQDARLLRQEGM